MHFNWPLKCSETAWKSKAQPQGKWSSGGNSSPIWVFAFPWAPCMSLVASEGTEPVCVTAGAYKMNTQLFSKNPKDLFFPHKGNESSTVLDIKCYHFVPHRDAVVVKARAQEMGCLDVFVIHVIKIVQADVIPQFIYCSYDTAALWLDPGTLPWWKPALRN